MPNLSARALTPMLDGWRGAGNGAAYSRLSDRIRLLVLDGRIPVETRLPAERDLAAQLEVSRTTVASAYASLRDAGYLFSVRGSGSVARIPGRAPIAIDTDAPGYLDLSKAALPASSAMPEAALWAAHELPNHLGRSGFDTLGLPMLREAIAERFTARGLPTSSEQIMVTTGAQSAIQLLARTLVSRGERVLVETPSYPQALDALRFAGARLAPVPVTLRDGWDLDAYEQSVRRMRPVLGYLMPDFHNPTGASLSDEHRAAMLALADRYGTVLVADETMAELPLHGAPVQAPFATHGPAITIGSVSKTIWGGVRVGWIRAERPVIQRLARARSAGDLGTPVLEQLIVLHLLEQYDAILEARRVALTTGHDRLLGLLRERFPEWEVAPTGGGLTFWVNLGLPVSSQLTLAARNEGLMLGAGPRFGIDGAFERFLRIPFSYPDTETDRALDALERAWAQVSRRPMPMPDDLLADVV